MPVTKGMRRAAAKSERRRQWVGENPLLVAYEISKEELTVQFGNREKVPYHRDKFPYSAAGLQAVDEVAKRLADEQGHDQVRSFMEPTGCYWMNAAWWEHQQGREYRLIHPVTTARERESTQYCHAKDDDRDVHVIHCCGSEGKFTETQLELDPVRVALRAAAAEYQLLEAQSTAEQNRILGWLWATCPRYETAFKNVFSMTSLSLLRTPGFLALLYGGTWEDLEQAVRRYQVGKRLQIGSLQKLQETLQSDAPDWGIPVYRGPLGSRINHAAERYYLCEQQQKRAAAAVLENYAQLPESVWLNTYAPLQPLRHALALAFVGNPDHYDISRTLVKLAGIEPTPNQSGGRHGKTRISRHGRTHLRWASIRNAFVLSRRDSVCMVRHHALTSRSQDPLKYWQSLTALAGKYLRTLHALCTQRIAYDPTVATGEKQPPRWRSPKEPAEDPKYFVEVVESNETLRALRDEILSEATN